MALQIRRGTQAERGTLTSGNGLVVGEPLYVTDGPTGPRLYIGDGTTPGGIAVTDFNATDAVNTIGAALNNNAHTGISFTYDFSGAGGSGRIIGTVTQNINALSDVTISGTPTDGQILKWDTATSQWINGAAPASTLDGLSDVIITGNPTTGEVIRYNGTNWVNGSSSLDNLSDVVITGTMTEGLVLRHDGTNWVASSVLTNEAIQDTVAGVLVHNFHTGISFTYQDGSDRIDAIVGFTSVNGDPSPSLGGNLSLNSRNITGTGNINITGSVTASAGVTSNSISRVGTNATLSLGSEAAPFDSVQARTDSFDVYGTTDGALGNDPTIQISSSRGTFAAKTASLTNDFVGTLAFRGHNGTDYRTTSLIINAIDTSDVGSTEATPGTLVFAVRDQAGNISSTYAQFNSRGTFSAPTLKTGGYATGSFPANPTEGMIIFDSTAKHFYGYTGSVGGWRQLDN